MTQEKIEPGSRKNILNLIRDITFKSIQEESVFQYGLLAAITLLAAALRFYKLGQWSFWIDEIFTINRALGHFNLETIIEQWWRPPVSILLTGGLLKILGIHEWSARLPSVLIGIATIPILYIMVAKLINRGVGFIAAFLLAISPWHIYWSQNARFYTSLLLFYFLASMTFFLFLEKSRIKYLVFFGIFFFLAISERYLAVLIGPVILTYVIAVMVLPTERSLRITPRTLGLLAIPAFAFIAIEIYSFLTTGTTQLIFNLAIFFGRPIDSPLRFFTLISFNLGFPLVSLGILSAVSMLYEKSRIGLYTLINAVVPVIIMVILSKFVFIVDRYAFITLPFWIVAVSYSIHWLYLRLGDRGLYACLAIVIVLAADAFGSNLAYFQLNSGNRPEWREAFKFVTDRAQNDDILVSSVPQVGSYYAKRDVLPLGEIKPQTIDQDGHRYWFVLDSENSWFTPEQKKWVEENAELLEIFYLRVRERMNLRIYFYDSMASP